MTVVQRCVIHAGEKLAELPDKACRAYQDVTLSGVFNVPCPVYGVRYDSTVFYLISAQ